ncbi:MAG: hypothetical protein ACRD2Z_05325 [Thermoanaerobaculia bacterium]
MPLTRSSFFGVGGWTISILAAGVVASCGGMRPVGEMALSTSSVELRYPARREVAVSWTPRRAPSRLEGPLHVFVHLRDAEGTILRTFDHPFPGEWEPGRTVQYPLPLYQSLLGPSLAPGDYELTVGLYDVAGHRWSLATAAPEVARQEYRVATVSVPPQSFDRRRFQFSRLWGEPVSDGDRQFLGRRWLKGPGGVRVTGIGGDGVVWMRVHVPAELGPMERLQLDDPAGQPAVRVSTDCGAGEQYLSGPGEHEVSLTVAPQGAAASLCRIRFEPNFHVVDLDTRERRALRLDALTWTPLSRGSS